MDGREFCFIHYPGVDNCHRWEIWRARPVAVGRHVIQPERLTDNAVQDCLCRFSSDGRYIYSRRGRGRNQKAGYGIASLDTSSLEQRFVFTVGEDVAIRSFSVSNLGLIAFVIEGDGEDEATLHVVDPESETRAEIPLGDADCQICSPCFVRP